MSDDKKRNYSKLNPSKADSTNLKTAKTLQRRKNQRSSRPPRSRPNRERRSHDGHNGPFRMRKNNPPKHDRQPRPTIHRRNRNQRRRHLQTLRRPNDRIPQRQHRIHIPTIQPLPIPNSCRKRRNPSTTQRRQLRTSKRTSKNATPRTRNGRQTIPPTHRTIRRSTTKSSRRQSPNQRPRNHPRRRTNRRPRLQNQRRRHEPLPPNKQNQQTNIRTSHSQPMDRRPLRLPRPHDRRQNLNNRTRTIQQSNGDRISKAYFAALIDRSVSPENSKLANKLQRDLKKNLKIPKSSVNCKIHNSFIFLKAEKTNKKPLEPKTAEDTETILSKHLNQYYSNNRSKLQKYLKTKQELKETAQIVKDFLHEIDPKLPKVFDLRIGKVVSNLPTEYCELQSKSMIALWHIEEENKAQFRLSGFEPQVLHTSTLH